MKGLVLVHHCKGLLAEAGDLLTDSREVVGSRPQDAHGREVPKIQLLCPDCLVIWPAKLLTQSFLKEVK